MTSSLPLTAGVGVVSGSDSFVFVLGIFPLRSLSRRSDCLGRPDHFLGRQAVDGVIIVEWVNSGKQYLFAARRTSLERVSLTKQPRLPIMRNASLEHRSAETNLAVIFGRQAMRSPSSGWGSLCHF